MQNFFDIVICLLYILYIRFKKNNVTNKSEQKIKKKKSKRVTMADKNNVYLGQ